MDHPDPKIRKYCEMKTAYKDALKKQRADELRRAAPAYLTNALFAVLICEIVTFPLIGATVIPATDWLPQTSKRDIRNQVMGVTMACILLLIGLTLAAIWNWHTVYKTLPLEPSTPASATATVGTAISAASPEPRAGLQN